MDLAIIEPLSVSEEDAGRRKQEELERQVLLDTTSGALRCTTRI
ncbi:MAG: hypothetical protein Q8O57_03940 [Kiritimatiellota bacterium]|nr:hypothetical protein [Kiritimatiellota bacterium]